MLLKHALLALVTVLVAVNQSTATTIYSQTQSGSVGSSATLIFTDALPAAGDATLSLIAKPGGELFNNNKRLEQLTVDGDTFQTPGNPAGWVRPVNFLDDQSAFPDPVTIPLALLNGYVADSQVVVSVTKPGFISGGIFDFVLEYTTTVPEPASGLLLAAGMAGLAFFRHRRVAHPVFGG